MQCSQFTSRGGRSEITTQQHHLPVASEQTAWCLPSCGFLDLQHPPATPTPTPTHPSLHVYALAHLKIFDSIFQRKFGRPSSKKVSMATKLHVRAQLREQGKATMRTNGRLTLRLCQGEYRKWRRPCYSLAYSKTKLVKSRLAL